MKTTGAAGEKVAAAKIATDRRFYMSGSLRKHSRNLTAWQRTEANILMTWYYQSDHKASHLFAVLFCARVWACLLIAVHIPSKCCHPIEVLPYLLRAQLFASGDHHTIEVLPSLAAGAALSFWWLLCHCPGAVLPYSGHHPIEVLPSFAMVLPSLAMCWQFLDMWWQSCLLSCHPFPWWRSTIRQSSCI